MAKCGDCIHFHQCSHYVTAEETFPEVGGCSAFKNKGDFVGVVRCKDCKYWREDILRDDDEMKCCSIGFYMTQGNNFCSFGKKIGGDGNG